MHTHTHIHMHIHTCTHTYVRIKLTKEAQSFYSENIKTLKKNVKKSREDGNSIWRKLCNRTLYTLQCRDFWRSERVSDGWELELHVVVSHLIWGLDLGSLEEHQVLLVLSHLQPQNLVFRSLCTYRT